MREHRFSWHIANREAIERDQRRSDRFWLGQGDRRQPLSRHQRDRLHLFEPFDAALCLARFGSLGTEAVDESLDALALGFLMGARRRIQGALLLAYLDEGIITAAVERELAMLQMQDGI